jgi:acetyl esterase/lipase
VKATLKRYRFFAAVAAIDLLLCLAQPGLGREAALNSWRFLAEVLAIVPPVMVLMGLLDAWTPRKLVEDNLGGGSGARGAGLALLLGTAAAGPLYAAFPVARSLALKGARTANIAIFLGTWAAIKIPMILMEMSFIGVRFALWRLAFTVPGVLAAGWLMERLAPLGPFESHNEENLKKERNMDQSGTGGALSTVLCLALLAGLAFGAVQAGAQSSPRPLGEETPAQQAASEKDRKAELYMAGIFGVRADVDAGAVRRKWLDVPYALLSPSEKLDVYLPDAGDGPFPVVVAIHGGSFSRGDKRDFQVVPVMAALGRGYAVASVNYRLSGEATFPSQIKDVAAAIRFLRAHARQYSLNPDKIAVWGDSAGGNLAALAGVSGNSGVFDDPALGNPGQSSRVAAVVDWYGPIDFLTLGHVERLRAVGAKMIGKTSLEAPELYAAANPETYLAPGAPPFLIQHGDADQVIPVGQSVDFAARAAKVLGKDRVTLDILPGADHLDLGFATPENLSKVLDFLDRNLK